MRWAATQMVWCKPYIQCFPCRRLPVPKGRLRRWKMVTSSGNTCPRTRTNQPTSSNKSTQRFTGKQRAVTPSATDNQLKLKVGSGEKDSSDDACADGGELLCCGSCPCTFHPECLAIKVFELICCFLCFWTNNVLEIIFLKNLEFTNVVV